MNRKIAGLIAIFMVNMMSVMAQSPQLDGTAAYPLLETRTKTAGHAVYYVHPDKGNDRNSGKSKKSAWQTFAPVNQHCFQPGDTIYVFPGRFTNTLMPYALGTAKKLVRIIFAPGVYHFERENLLHRKYHISNTNDAPNEYKALAICIDRSQHLQLLSKDALFYMHGKMIEVCLDQARNISFNGLRFDYNRPTVSEYKVLKVSDQFADLEIHADSKFAIRNNQVVWIGDGWEHGQSGHGQAYDLAKMQLSRSRNPLSRVKKVEMLDKPQQVRAWFEGGNPGFHEGFINQTRQVRRDCVGIFQNRSKNIRWENCSFHYFHGMGMVSQFTENIALKDITIAPRPESGRTCATWADMLHFSGCGGLLDIENVYFSGANDDAINIHGTHLRITERISDTQIKVRFMHGQTFGFDGFRPGDAVDFIRIETMAPYAANKVVKVERLNDRESILTMASKVPEQIGPLDALENTTWTANAHIRGCTVKFIPTRGFLITTRGKVLVENNIFYRTGMPGILVEDDARGWYESGVVRDLTIRNNHFVECAENVITIDPKVTSTTEPTHKNIQIYQNHFYLKDGRGILHAKNCEGVVVKENQIYVTANHQKPAEKYVHLEAVRGGQVEKNQVNVVTNTFEAFKAK